MDLAKSHIYIGLSLILLALVVGWIWHKRRNKSARLDLSPLEKIIIVVSLGILWVIMATYSKLAPTSID